MDDFFVYATYIIVSALAGLMSGLVIGYILGRNDERNKKAKTTSA